jgi:uncharacterized membrane protein
MTTASFAGFRWNLAAPVADYMNLAKEIAMPKVTFAGHPLHPMLIVAPAALIPFGFILDAMHRSTGNERYADAAYYSLMGGLIGGLAAGTAGTMDYLTIQPETDLKRTANVHAMLNSSALTLTAANLLARKNKPGHRGGSLALSAIAALGVLVSGWFGGHMVYEHGMRVKGVSPVEQAPELTLPGSEAVEHAMLQEEKLVPAGGPVLH